MQRKRPREDAGKDHWDGATSPRTPGQSPEAVRGKEQDCPSPPTLREQWSTVLVSPEFQVVSLQNCESIKSCGGFFFFFKLPLLW